MCVCWSLLCLLEGKNVNGKIKSETTILFLPYVFSLKNVITGKVFCKHFLSVY